MKKRLCIILLISLGFVTFTKSQSYKELTLEIMESIIKLNESKTFDDSKMSLIEKDSILSFSKYLFDIIYYKNKIELFEEKADTFALKLALENAIKIRIYHDKTSGLYRIYKPFYLSSFKKLVELYDGDLDKLNTIFIFHQYRREAYSILKPVILKNGGVWNKVEPQYRIKHDDFDNSVWKSEPAKKE